MILIYYIHDLPKQKLLQRKMQFVANEMAAALQNIARQKTTITKTDITNATRLVWLSMFPGMTQYSSPTNNWRYMPLGYRPMMRIYYVTGLESSVAKVKWLCRGHAGYDGFPIYGFQSYTSEPFPKRSVLKSWSGKASDIYPNLRISQAGDVKIIVECSLHNEPLMRFPVTNKPTSSVSKREMFGFLLYNPISISGEYSYFSVISIFTPQGGFSEVPPQ